LSGSFAQQIGYVREAEMFLDQKSSEILEAGIGNFHMVILANLTFQVNVLVGIDKNNLKG
jgi:hypothetical protein